MLSSNLVPYFGGTVILVGVVVGCVSQPHSASDNQRASPAPATGPAHITAQNNAEGQATPETNATSAGQPLQPQAVQQSQNQQSQIQPSPNPDYEALDGQIVAGKKLSIPKITGSVPPRDDEYHDTDNNAIMVLQSPTEAMADFPRDRRNEVDWVKTLDQGLIEPRADLLGKSEMVTMDLDIVMKNTQFMPWVRFPHIAHTRWLACENCHSGIFIPREGANPITMNKVLRGEFCGVCHDKVAFSLFVCERCHSVPHEGSGPAWWK